MGLSVYVTVPLEDTDAVFYVTHRGEGVHGFQKQPLPD